MFNSREEIKNDVINLLNNNHNSKIIFIVGSKGIGKEDCLSELSNALLPNKSILSHKGSSNFMSDVNGVIYRYLKNNNSFDERKRFCGILSNNLPVLKESFARCDIDQLIQDSVQCYSINDRRDILELLLFEVIDNTPIVLCEEYEKTDSYYFDLVKNKKYTKKSITLIMTIEAIEENIALIEHLYHQEELQVFPFFLLPTIIKESSECYPLSVSEIAVKIRNKKEYCCNVAEDSFGIEQYCEAYTLANDMIAGGLTPKDVFIIAKQELSLCSDCRLNQLLRIIYNNKRFGYHNKTVLQVQAKYYLYNSIFYYFFLKNGIEEYINCIQIIFLEIANKSILPIDKKTQILFNGFLSSFETKNKNQIAPGMALYVSRFAEFTKIFFSKKHKAKRNPRINANIDTNILMRTLMCYSDELMRFLKYLYDNTQNNNILEIGLLSVKETNGLSRLYDYKTQRFLNLCVSAALRTNDITLIESIKNTLMELLDQKIPFYINNIDLLRPDKRSLVEPILEAINNRGYSIDDYIDRKTVFLSYNHHQMEIADLIDDNLEALGFRVIRDKKYLSTYDSIQVFMESSKNYDYSVALISKEFLSSNHAMFEMLNIFQKSNYYDTTFIVALIQNNDDLFKRDFWNSIKAEWERKAQNNNNINNYNTSEQYDKIRQYSDVAEKLYSEFFLSQLISVIDLNKSITETGQIIQEITDTLRDKVVCSEAER